MSKVINLKRGLDIPVKGAAALELGAKVVPTTVAVKPGDFKGLVPKLLVREGDKVLAGSPVLSDKTNPDILVTSPVSGTVAEVVRGAKRKLLAVVISADKTQEYVDFGVKDVQSLSSEEVKEALLKSGLWGSFIQRPFGVIASTEVRPKAIFVSAFNTAPLAADVDFALGADAKYVQTGINAISKLTDGGVHVSFNENSYSGSPFHKLENVIQHTFTGKHPAGNVGVQISHISPIRKDETVWTISLLHLAAIGKLFACGKLDLSRKVAVTGPAAEHPAYVETVAGAAVADIVAVDGDVRVIGGDILSGENLGEKGYLGFHQNQLTLVREGREKEVLGWAKPFRPKLFSSSMTYFSWLTPKKTYDMDTNLHGGPRAFVQTKCFADVTPIDIFPIYLIKACLAKELENMEKFGIYEVLPEDLALCDYVDPSKNDIQAIIAEGIDYMIKELA